VGEPNKKGAYDQELLDMHVEAFKHMTTLNLAAAVAVLVLAREAGAPRGGVIALAAFGISLLWSVTASSRTSRSGNPLGST
jgi:hypothetical protein